MDTITSQDGTIIAWHRSGSGAPLVLVQGTGAANPRAWPAFPALAESFSVLAVDRRGRGQSEDNAAYAIEREFEDVAAVIDAVGEPVNVLGHSFGALVALEAALRTSNLRRLILYEPAIPPPDAVVYTDGVLDRLEVLIEAGEWEGALLWHYTEIVGLRSHEVEPFRLSPAWPERLATAHSLAREMRAEEQYRFVPERFKDLQTPTLLLLGSNSAPLFKETTEAIDAALPDSHIAVLSGQEHVAMYAAPDLFVQEVLAFLSEPD